MLDVRIIGKFQKERKTQTSGIQKEREIYASLEIFVNVMKFRGIFVENEIK